MSFLKFIKNHTADVIAAGLIFINFFLFLNKKYGDNYFSGFIIFSLFYFFYFLNYFFIAKKSAHFHKLIKILNYIFFFCDYFFLI